MPFVEQEEHYEDHVIDGKAVKVYKKIIYLLLHGKKT